MTVESTAARQVLRVIFTSIWTALTFLLSRQQTPRDSLQSKVDRLNKICGRASTNIATRRTKEHIYDMGEGEFSILAGCGSVKYFRDNFCKRLAEAFGNLDWILKNRSTEFNRDEFKLYESVYNNCESLYSSSRSLKRPRDLKLAADMYKQLKERMDQTIATGGTSGDR